MRTFYFTVAFLCATFRASVGTLPHAQRLQVVRPQKLNSRHKRGVPDQATRDSPHPDELLYRLPLEGRKRTLHLQRNGMLFGPNYTETYYLEDGTPKTLSPNYKDHCYYHGHVEGMEDSSVSVGVCAGITGFVRVGHQLYLIEPLEDGAAGDHALYKPEPRRAKRSACRESNSTSGFAPRASGWVKAGGQKAKSSFSVPRFVELVLVVDNTEYSTFGGNMEKIRERMFKVANHIDKLYQAVNIRVVLVGLEVWSDKDKIRVSANADYTLTRFLDWRQESLVKRMRHDNAQFVTGIDFLGDTVGLATKYAMCMQKSAGINQDHNINPLGIAATVAHEMGHNLGMSHDEAGCTCGVGGQKCIMTDRVNSDFPELFSDCSLSQLSEFLDLANPSCLLDAPKADRAFGGPVCGNGFLDVGEECDCGTVNDCNNPCCNPATCRLAEGARCAQGGCCENCQLRQAGSLCRMATNECDLAEYCPGDSKDCPVDSYVMNGGPCNSGDGYCYNGQCPSLQQHCTRLWGSGAQVGQNCFHINLRGERDSHCGKTTNGYKRCTEGSKFCGKIFCTGGGENPFVGRKGVFVLYRGNCNIVADDSDTDNLSMVPVGTKCGDNKVCYDHVCQDVAVYGNVDCSLKCSGHGVCNHKKECHCDPGWAEPYCNTKITDLKDNHIVIVAVSATLALLFLAALLITALKFGKGGKGLDCVNKKKPRSARSSYQDGKPMACSTPLQISLPKFIESSSSQVCSPSTVSVVPSRPPPLPPQNSPKPGPQSCNVQMKPVSPARPLPPVQVKHPGKPTPPPVPAAKPTGLWAEGRERKVALSPAHMPR
uniref:Disintegrin and metalloproteinase domain-containing protein 8 n=1 Tax=Denticeps clupeoides TaxID=299321 RepID=A0AAY4AGD1_9TELE